MFIDPLTLFILGEIFVVYIIINVFLFFNGRLYKVLVALLKEMRFEKLRREQVKQQELAALRAKNIDLLAKNKKIEASIKSAGKSISEQLADRIEGLKDENPHVQDLQNSVELDQSPQWLRLRLLELEQELLSGNIDETKWQEMASEAIQRLQLKDAEESELRQDRKDSAGVDLQSNQLQNDLEENQRLYNDALIRIRQLEGEVEEIRAINTPSENMLSLPEKGLHEDDIYRLKCDNFDLNEVINKLKLDLQQTDATLDSDTYMGLLENQISNMEQYIKTSDIATGLMEKELAAAQKENKDLLNKLNSGVNGPAKNSLESLKQLTLNQSAQTDTLDLFKDSIDRIKAGEDATEIALEQEQYVSRLEQIIKESDQCINILESALASSQRDVDSLEDQLSSKNIDLINTKFEGLNSIQDGQKSGLSSIKSIIKEIKDGGDTEILLAKQEDEIGQLERFLSESDSIISQLETEITSMQEKLDALENQPSNKAESKRPNSDEDMEEMEKLLQQFIADMQSTLKVINKLEDENLQLKSDLKASSKADLKADRKTDLENKLN